jgi:Zn-dependent protease
MDNAQNHVLAQKTQDGILVLTFTQPLLDANAVAEARTIITTTESRKVILSFQSIRQTVSAGLFPDQAPFVPLRELNNQLTKEGGRLVLCNLAPELAEVFRITRLDQEFVVQPHVNAAVAYLARANQPATTPLSQPSNRILLPVLLFIATCLSTWLSVNLAYAFAVMTILLAHEMGHYLQTRRYGVPASLPYFIPMPLSLIGTMGAVIVMQPRRGDRRSLFDIAVSGPLAGLVPALLFAIIGLYSSEIIAVQQQGFSISLGEPLIFQALAYLTHGPLAEGQDIALHPLAFAGWVGLFITALNLIPIGQLDGGHILYSLLLRLAHPIAKLLLAAAMVAVVIWGYYGWIVMIFLLFLMGPAHPPTANDNIPLGTGRTVLGWACLFFVPLGITPVPFEIRM